MYSRQELDAAPHILGLQPVYDEDETSLLVNGMMGKYKLWVSKSDTSITPCLTGEVGGMPGAWENWVTAWHTKVLPNFNTYIDIGANSGYFSGLAAFYGLAVISVEANPVYADLLNRTIEENKFDNWAVVEGAISNINDSKATLTIPDELHGGASIRGGDSNLPGKEISVSSMTLDSFQGPVGSKVLIKMDIEGAEEMAWQGAQDFNRRHKPTYVLEYTPRHYSEGFYDSLVEYGQVSMVDTNGNEMVTTKNIANGSDDWVTLVVRPHG